MKILLFGANGMLGKYMHVYLEKLGYNIIPITRATFDIYKLYISNTLNSTVKMLVQKHQPDLIINCAGITNKRPDICRSEMYIVNGYFPHVLDNVCTTTLLVHPTTDCVFNGDKGMYTEDDSPNCTDDYGISKSLGECLRNACVIRVSIIGESSDKSSLIEWFKSQKSCDGYTNHYWNGITCLEYAKMINEMIRANTFWKGVKHIASPEIVTKYWLLTNISDIFKLNITVNKFETDQKCDRSLIGKTRTSSLLTQLKELEQFSKCITL